MVDHGEVVAGAALDPVGDAVAGADRVVAGSAFEPVPAGTADDAVAADGAEDAVRPSVAVEADGTATPRTVPPGARLAPLRIARCPLEPAIRSAPSSSG